MSEGMQRLTRAQLFVRGLEILVSYEPDADFAVAHDELYFGAISPAQVSEEHLRELDAGGWFFDEDTESWTNFP